MSSLPFKLVVLNAVTDAFKQISPANGYVSDLSDFDDGGVTQTRVFRGRAWFGDNDPIPMLSVLEAPTPSDSPFDLPADSPVNGYDWGLIVQGFVNDDPQNPTDPAYLLLADVRRRLAAEKVRKVMGRPGQRNPFGLGEGTPAGKVEMITFGTGVVRPADDISAKAYMWLPLTLRIIENADRPYG